MMTCMSCCSCCHFNADLLLMGSDVHHGMAVPVQAFNFVTALNPFSPTFDEDNQRDVKKRPRGPTQKAMDPVSRPQEYLGTSGGFGFTKKNELLVGRIAMLVRRLCPSAWQWMATCRRLAYEQLLIGSR